MPEDLIFKNLIEEALRKKNVQVEADVRDLKNLRVKVPSLFIVNQALDDVDELVLIKLLASSGIDFKLIERGSISEPALAHHFLHLDYYLLQWQDYVRAIFKELVKAKAGGYSLCLILH